MTTDVPIPDYGALGRALRARREARKQTRADIERAGGPSQATTQRIEEGEIKRAIKAETKRGLEDALELRRGWIDDHLAGRVDEAEAAGDVAVVERDGERLLVAITTGVAKLSLEERRVVLTLVQGLQKGSNE